MNILQIQENKDLERIKLIHKILKTLLKTGYNFKETYKLEKENVALLKEGKDQYYWNPTGYELIRFEVWFLSKVH